MDIRENLEVRKVRIERLCRVNKSDASVEDLVELSECGDGIVLECIAKHRNTPEYILVKFADWIIKAPKYHDKPDFLDSCEIFGDLCGVNNFNLVISSLLKNPNTPSEILKGIYERISKFSEFPFNRFMNPLKLLEENRNTPQEILIELFQKRS